MYVRYLTKLHLEWSISFLKVKKAHSISCSSFTNARNWFLLFFVLDGGWKWWCEDDVSFLPPDNLILFSSLSALWASFMMMMMCLNSKKILKEEKEEGIDGKKEAYRSVLPWRVLRFFVFVITSIHLFYFSWASGISPLSLLYFH